MAELEEVLPYPQLCCPHILLALEVLESTNQEEEGVRVEG